MGIHRVHTHRALEPGLELVLQDGSAHYLGRVLRVTSGQAVVLFNGDGYEYATEVLRVGRREISLAVKSRLPGMTEPAIGVTVVQALSRGQRMDQTLQKCTELGAAAFQTLLGDRAGLKLVGEKLARRLEHWQGVVISACEQCGRSHVPEVRPPLTVEEWLKKRPGGGRFVLDPDGSMPLAGMRFERNIELAVGPEGGFSAGELALMRHHRVRSVSLGPRILRTETAAPAAVAILQALHGDMGSPVST